MSSEEEDGEDAGAGAADLEHCELPLLLALLPEPFSAAEVLAVCEDVPAFGCGGGGRRGAHFRKTTSLAAAEQLDVPSKSKAFGGVFRGGGDSSGGGGRASPDGNSGDADEVEGVADHCVGRRNCRYGVAILEATSGLQGAAELADSTGGAGTREAVFEEEEQSL